LAIAAPDATRACVVRAAGGAQRQHARGVELGGHVGEHPLDRLVVGDRLAEGVARLGVGQRLVERGLADAERLRRDGDAPASRARRASAKPLPGAPSS
jgi:hypothetical protein